MEDDEEDYRIIRDEARSEANMRENLLASMLTERYFRAFVWEILSQCGIYADGFSPDPLAMAFAAGKRNIGLSILARVMSANPQSYVTMQQENKVPNE